MLARFNFQGRTGIFRLLKEICGHMYQAAHAHGSSLYKLLLVLAGQIKQKTKELQRLLLMRLGSGKEGDMHTFPLLACTPTRSLYLPVCCNPSSKCQTKQDSRLSTSVLPQHLILMQ